MRQGKTMLAIACAVAAGGAGTAAASEPIEGVWAASRTATSQFLVQPDGVGGFRETIVRGSDAGTCVADQDGFVNPVGQETLRVRGSGADYTGTDAWFDGNCHKLGDGAATVHIDTSDPANLKRRVCTAPPGRGPVVTDSFSGNPVPPTNCYDSVRVAPPQAPPTAAQVIKLPSARTCRSRRNLRIHLRSAKYDPLVKATVFVNGKRVKVVVGSRRLSAPVDLRGLPKGRYTVKISATTATGRVLNATRRFRTCTPKGH